MPIQSVIQRWQPGRGLRRIGKLRKGGARTEEDKQRNRPGRDLHYFRATFEDDPEHLLADAFATLYGAQPTQIKGVYLLGATVNEALDFWLEEWGKSGLVRRCDGATLSRQFNPNTGRAESCTLPCARANGGKCGCKAVGRLNILLPEFMRHTGEPGYLTLETHGMVDIDHLHALLMEVERLAGTLDGVPLVVSRVEREVPIPKVNDDGTVSRVKVKKWMIQIKPDPDVVKKQMAAGVARVALPERVIDTSTGEISDGRPLLGAGDQRPAVTVPEPDEDDIDDALDDEADFENAAHWATDPAQFDIFWTWLTGHYRVFGGDEVLAFLEIEAWTDLPANARAAAEHINTQIMASGGSEASFPMFATTATYRKQTTGAYFEFNGFYKARWYGHREQLAAMTNTPKLAEAQHNAAYTLTQPISFSWERKGTNGNSYLLVVGTPTLIERETE